MKKTSFLLMLSVIVVASSCKSTKFSITTGGENLGALTRVTDQENPCIDPFGGDLGENLFFVATDENGFTNIFSKDNAFSAAMTQKTSGRNKNFSPAYNHSIDKIAFRSRSEGAATSDIMMMNSKKGSSLQAVTESADAFEDNPSFSPDGNLIVYDKQSYSVWKKKFNFASFFGKEDFLIVEKSEIWLKNLKTGENVLLAPGYQPRFSPDGTKIVYVKYASDLKSTSIWIMSLDATQQSQLTDAKKGFALDPRWSPDGKHIIFSSAKKDDKKDFDIYMIDTDGDHLTQLTINNSTDRGPYWTQDNYIYFYSDRGNKKGNYQIWRFKLDL